MRVKLLFISLLLFVLALTASAQMAASSPVAVGTLNGRAKTLVQPAYPPTAAEKGVSGSIRTPRQ